jgi:small subunit ribosomal protein S7e
MMSRAPTHVDQNRFLDAKDQTSLEYKLDSFSSVYRRLTGKDVVFEFPAAAQE